MDAKIEVGRILFPVMSLGPGRRAVVWMQGCARATEGNPCKGCISSDLWHKENGTAYSISTLASILSRHIVENDLSGMTITGGEPLDDAESLLRLIRTLKEELADKSRSCDYLLFTSHTSGTVQKDFPEIWSIFDVLVCGEYQADRPCDRPLVASENQELIILNDGLLDAYASIGSQPRIQAFVNDDAIEFAGIPLPKEMAAIEESLLDRGITIENATWR